MRVTVEVWSVALGDVPDPSPRELQGLSADERARHARYLVPEPARIFAVTRLALRQLLGQRLGCAPEAIRLATDDRGKPRLASAAGVEFNVSHCASCALIALCEEAPVGVDVEMRTALTLDMPVSAAVCSSAELAWLRADVAQADAALTRLWVRKEAILKARGAGLRFPFPAMDLGVPDATAGTLLTLDLGRIVWRDLALATGEAAVVAIMSDEACAIDTTLRRHGLER